MIDLSKHKQGTKVVVKRKNGEIVASGKLYILGRELWVIRKNSISNVFTPSFLDFFFYYDPFLPF